MQPPAWPAQSRLQVCREFAPFSPQARWGDDGARRVRNDPAQPLGPRHKKTARRRLNYHHGADSMPALCYLAYTVHSWSSRVV